MSTVQRILFTAFGLFPPSGISTPSPHSRPGLLQCASVSATLRRSSPVHRGRVFYFEGGNQA